MVNVVNTVCDLPAARILWNCSFWTNIEHCAWKIIISFRKILFYCPKISRLNNELSVSYNKHYVHIMFCSNFSKNMTCIVRERFDIFTWNTFTILAIHSTIYIQLFVSGFSYVIIFLTMNVHEKLKKNKLYSNFNYSYPSQVLELLKLDIKKKI